MNCQFIHILHEFERKYDEFKNSQTLLCIQKNYQKDKYLAVQQGLSLICQQLQNLAFLWSHLHQAHNPQQPKLTGETQMNNQLMQFDFERQPIQAILMNNEPYFYADEVCITLGYKNPRDAIARHVDEDDVVKHDTIDNLGRTQQKNIINESGLYALIFGSKLESAKRFKRWVTSEVLPAIRKHGVYAQNELLENMDYLMRQVNQLKAEKENPFTTGINNISLDQALKFLGYPPKKTKAYLEYKGAFFRSDDEHQLLQPYQRDLKDKLFFIRAETHQNKIYPQIRVTARGLEWLRHNLPQELQVA